MKQKLKSCGEVLFFTAATVGIIDMSIQATTGGKIKPIRLFLQWVFG